MSSMAQPLFKCEFCDEMGIELQLCKIGTPWNIAQTYVDGIEMHCVRCGVREPCDSDDLVGYMMDLLDEDNYQKAMLHVLRMLWDEKFLKDVKE
jgi:hypothetical protein